MLYPELVYTKEVSDRYNFSITKGGFAAMADAVELDLSHLDAFSVRLSTKKRNNISRTLGRYTFTQYLAEDGSSVRSGVIDLFLDEFVGYGNFGYSPALGMVKGMSAEDLDNLNFSGVLLHELLHMSRIEKLHKGEKLPYLSSRKSLSDTYFPYGFQTVDREEAYVLYQTATLLQDDGTLQKAGTIKRKS
jgi:hypothetical protein